MSSSWEESEIGTGTGFFVAIGFDTGIGVGVRVGSGVGIGVGAAVGCGVLGGSSGASATVSEEGRGDSICGGIKRDCGCARVLAPTSEPWVAK